MPGHQTSESVAALLLFPLFQGSFHRVQLFRRLQISEETIELSVTSLSALVQQLHLPSSVADFDIFLL